VSPLPTSGVCRHCGVTDEQVDGNKLSWHDASRTCCSKYACVKAHHNAARKRAVRPKSRFAELIAQGYGSGGARLQIEREDRQRRRNASPRKGRAA
jgi:hypothetical protein